jgi:hypothetical protein
LADRNIILEAPTNSAAIDSKTAVETAKAKHPEWASVAKEIKVENQLLTNKNWEALPPIAFEKNPALKSKGHPERIPVYIVSFQGLNEQARSFPKNFQGTPPAPTTEWNVVVDATTGIPLMSFTYR